MKWAGRRAKVCKWRIPGRRGSRQGAGDCISQSVQSLIRVPLFAIPRTTAHQASLSITNSWSFLKLMSIESVRPSNHLTLCYPFLLLPSIFQPFNPSTPASGSFPVSQFFASGGQSTGVSASTSVLPMNTQD